MSSSASSSGSEDDTDSNGSLEHEARDAEERDAILEATRLAALLKGGIDNVFGDDDDSPILSSRLTQTTDDLPRMPSSSRPSQTTKRSSNAASPKATASQGSSRPPAFPMMPMPSGGGGASAAMAAFEAQRKQMRQPSDAMPRKSRVSATDSFLQLVQEVESVTSAKPPKKFSGGHQASSLSMLRQRDGSDASDSTSNSDDSSSDDSSSSASSSSSESDSDSDSDSSFSSASDSDSGSSDSAPSEHHTYSDRHRDEAATSSHIARQTAGDDTTVPPGQGSRQTKRRNKMRRAKLQILRDAENEKNFTEAAERAARRERGEAVNDDDEEAKAQISGWYDDRTPMYQIKGVGLAGGIAADTASRSANVADVMPPGGGSLGLADETLSAVQQIVRLADEASKSQSASNNAVAAPAANIGASASTFNNESSKSTKRKRGDESQAAAQTVEDTLPTQAPFAEEVPAGMSIRHVDCQAYYDEELAKLEGQQCDGGEDQHEDGYADQQQQRQRGKRNKGKQRDIGDDVGVVSGVEVELDYGQPDEVVGREDDESVPRKRARLEPEVDVVAPSDTDIVAERSTEAELEENTSGRPSSNDDFSKLDDGEAGKDSPPAEQVEKVGEEEEEVEKEVEEEDDHDDDDDEDSSSDDSNSIQDYFGPKDEDEVDDTWLEIVQQFTPARFASSSSTPNEDRKAAWHHIQVGQGLLLEELSLHPSGTPEVMKFVGVVREFEESEEEMEDGAKRTKEVKVVEFKGPLLRNKRLDWDDYWSEYRRWEVEDFPEGQVWRLPV